MSRQERDWAEQVELRDLHIEGLCETVRNQQATIKALARALEDAINAPLGVVPQSADRFWNGQQGCVRRDLI